MLNKIARFLTCLGGVWLVHRISYIFRRRVCVDRVLVQGKSQALVLLLFLVLTVPLLFWFIFELLGFEGKCFVQDDVGGNPSLIWSVFYHYIDPGNQHMAVSGISRMYACIIALIGSVLMNGILISAFVGWYERFVDNWRTGLARYDKLLKNSKFIVIVGGCEMVPNIISQLFERVESPEYIVLQTSQDVELLRRRLVSFLTRRDEERVIIYFGERTSKDDIKDLHLEYAQEVFVLGDSIEDDYRKTHHDAINMNCLQLVSDELKNTTRNNKLICKVMFEYQTSFSIFQFADISDNIKKVIDFRPFNYYELWAQRIFVNNKLAFTKMDLSNYLPLEGERPITYESDDFIHLVIVGMSKMGVAVGIEAAHLAHYPNFIKNHTLKTRITFIDANCISEMRYFQGRFKELFSLAKWRSVISQGNLQLYEDSMDSRQWQNANLFSKNHYLGDDFIDVEWEFIEGGIETAEIHDYLTKAVENRHARFTLAICLPQDNESVAAALYLPDTVYAKALQILVYQRHNSSIIDSISLNNKMNIYYKQLKAFGMLSDAYNDGLQNTMYQVSEILNELYYKMYQQVNIENNIRENERQNTRGKSSTAKRWSNIYNACSIWTKLRSIRYTTTHMISDENEHLLANTEHNRWVLEQLLMRFRPLSEEEQNEVQKKKLDKEMLKGDKMAHLDICSYSKLSDVDSVVKKYDEGFIRILPQILKEIAQE